MSDDPSSAILAFIAAHGRTQQSDILLRMLLDAEIKFDAEIRRELDDMFAKEPTP